MKKNQAVLNRVSEALEKAMKRFEEDKDVIFESDKERIKLKFDKKFLSVENWSKAKQCIYKGCTEKSIIRSHSIQKSTSLHLISENGHVLTPQANIVNENIGVTKIGLNEASTFPGFCEKHEKLFEDFEMKKELTGEMHFMLQTYRAVCREIVRNQHLIQVLENRKSQYVNFRNGKIMEFMKRDLGEEFLKNANVTLSSFKFSTADFRERLVSEKINSANKYLNGFLRPFDAAILNDVKKGKSQNTYGEIRIIDIQLPVSMAGRGNFFIRMPSNKKKEIQAIFNVLPYSDKTYISLATFHKNKNDIQTYLRNFQNPIDFISMIESWMIYGSDHWFIKPSVWTKIQPVYREQITNDLLDYTKNIGSKYHKTIFNDLKREIISELESKLAAKPNALIKTLIDEEKVKFTD